MLDERPDEGHLFAGIVEDDLRIRGVATEAIGCHDHGQVARIHLGHRSHFCLGEDLHGRRFSEDSVKDDKDLKGFYLKEADEVGEDEPVELWEAVDDAHGPLGIRAVLDAIRVQLIRYEGLVELPVPQLE